MHGARRIEMRKACAVTALVIGLLVAAGVTVMVHMVGYLWLFIGKTVGK